MKDKKVDIDKLNRDIYLLTTEEPEMLDELLELEGYDPKQLEKNGISKIRALMFRYTVASKKAQNDNLYAKAMDLFVSAKETTREGILMLLRQRAPQLQFNNLEKMDETDLRDILDETDLLDLMAKIEKGEV